MSIAESERGPHAVQRVVLMWSIDLRKAEVVTRKTAVQPFFFFSRDHENRGGAATMATSTFVPLSWFHGEGGVAREHDPVLHENDLGE